MVSTVRSPDVISGPGFGPSLCRRPNSVLGEGVAVASLFYTDGKEFRKCNLCCVLLQHPTRPMPVHTTRRKYVTRSSPIRKPGVTASASPIKGAEWNARSPPGRSAGRGVPFTCTPHGAPARSVPDPTHTVEQRDQKPHSVSLGDAQASTKTPGLGVPFLLQPLAKYPPVDAPSLRNPAAQSWGQDSNLSLHVPGKRAAQTSTQASQNAPKKPKLSPCLPPKKGTQRPDQGILQTRPPPASQSELRPAVEIQAPTTAAAQGQSIHPQPPHPTVPRVAHQPLRMAFTRLGSGQWSSRVITPPSPPPAEKPTPAGPSPPTSHKSEGLCAPVPVSVLPEDLQLSSFSEDSDSQ